MNDQVPVRRRFWFSLRTLALLTTIVALAVSVTLLYRELVPLRAEVARLRDQVGELYVEDPNLVHAIGVETDSEVEWKWRVWIPEGKVCRVRVAGGAIPEKDFPTSGGSISIDEPGEHVIEYKIRLDPRSDKWYGGLQTRGASLGADEQPWVEWPSKTWSSRGVGRRASAFETDEPIELLRHCVWASPDSAGKEYPAPGFLVWLEIQ